MVADDNTHEIVSVSIGEKTLSNAASPNQCDTISKCQHEDQVEPQNNSQNLSNEDNNYSKHNVSKVTTDNKQSSQVSFSFYTYFEPSETDKGMLVFRRHILRKILQSNSSKNIKNKFSDAFFDRRIRCVENVSLCKIEICCLKDNDLIKGLPRRKIVITGPKYGNIFVALNELEHRCPQIFENAVFPNILPGSSNRWPTKNKIMTRTFQSSYLFHKKCNLTSNIRLNSWENRIMPHRIYPNKETNFKNQYFSCKTNLADSCFDDLNDFSISFENVKGKVIEQMKSENDTKCNTAILDNKNATLTLEVKQEKCENLIEEYNSLMSPTQFKSTMINEEELLTDTFFSESSEIFKNKTVVDPSGDRIENNENFGQNKSLQENRDYMKACFPEGYNIHKVCNAVDIRYTTYDPPCFKNIHENSRKSPTTIGSNKITETFTDTLWINNKTSLEKVSKAKSPPICVENKNQMAIRYVDKKQAIEVYNSGKASVVSMKYSDNKELEVVANSNDLINQNKKPAKGSLLLRVVGSKSKDTGRISEGNSHRCTSEVKIFSTDKLKKKPVIYRNIKKSKKQSSKVKKLDCSVWNPFLIKKFENKAKTNQRYLNESGCLINTNLYDNITNDDIKRNLISLRLDDPSNSNSFSHSSDSISKELKSYFGLPNHLIDDSNITTAEEEDSFKSPLFTNFEGNLQRTFFSEEKVFGSNSFLKRKMKVPRNIYTKQFLDPDTNGELINSELLKAQLKWNCTIIKVDLVNPDFYELTLNFKKKRNFNNFCLEMGFSTC